MAVPKKKISRRRSKTRRTHYTVNVPGLSFDKSTGLYRPPHRICPTTGQYNGKKIVNFDD
jgi:large subunit ribosomal protein L32